MKKQPKKCKKIQKGQFGQNKVQFCYIKPIEISDDEEFQINTKNSLSPSQQNDLTQKIESQFQQIIYEITTCKQVGNIKFDKGIFVRFKNTDYKADYKVIKENIGKGSYGVVQMVKSRCNKQLRAAKVISKSRMSKQETQKFLAEVYIMKQLDHANIANIYQTYDYKNQFIMICQLCTGGDLYKYLKSAPAKVLPQKLVGCVIKQLLKTVIYLHSKGIVHRDIKPHNILFEKQGNTTIKLIDFGISTKCYPDQKLKAKIGSPAYLAPELIQQSYNEKIDVWAIGITMYHLLSGNTPYQGSSVQKLMTSIVKDPVKFTTPIWNTIDPQCKRVIDKMLVKHPRLRPSAKQIYQDQYFNQFQMYSLSLEEKQNFAANLRNFQFKNKLQAIIQTFIASQLLNVEEKQQLMNLFQSFDTNHDGVISTEELKKALCKRNNITQEKVEALMGVIDTNGSGQIDYTEFLTVGFLDGKQFTISRIKQAFQHFDKDGSGQISIDQVKYFMEEFGESPTQVVKLFKQFDLNNDGQITEDQFVSMMLRKSENVSLTKIREQSQKQLVLERVKQIDFDKIFQVFQTESTNEKVIFDMPKKKS